MSYELRDAACLVLLDMGLNSHFISEVLEGGAIADLLSGWMPISIGLDHGHLTMYNSPHILGWEHFVLEWTDPSGTRPSIQELNMRGNLNLLRNSNGALYKN